MNLGDYQKRIHQDGDSYKKMVVALRAFANEMLFDDKARQVVANGSARCGRTMKTSAANRRSPSTDITPDLLVQPSASYGVIAECKWGIPTSPGYFSKYVEETIEQLEKYDDDLANWPGASDGTPVAGHDLVLLVNHEDSKRLAQELVQRRAQNSLRITRNFAIVGVISEYPRASGVWTELDLEEGKLSDVTKTAKLKGRVYIKPADLDRNPYVAMVQLCDTSPPAPVMMELIFKAVNNKLSREQNEQRRLDGKTKQPVTLEELVEWVGRFAFPQTDKHDAVCPRQQWIRDAMTSFVAMKWAERPDAKVEEWVFLHQRGRKTPYKGFIGFCARRDLRNDLQKKKLEVRAAAKIKKKRLADEAKLKARQAREESRKAKQLAQAIADAPLFAEQLKLGGVMPSSPKKRRVGKEPIPQTPPTAENS